MYYVWSTDFRQTNAFAYFENEPSGYETAQWTSGVPIGPKAPKLGLSVQSPKALPLSDLVLVTRDIQIHSPKLAALLKSLGATNIEYFPVELKYNGATVGDGFQIANIVGRVHCVDLENSAIEYFSDQTIMSVEEFEILEEKIQPLPGMKTPPKLFRLGESQFVILVHQSVKDACEREKITGIRFVRTQDFG